jgi:RHS repeat-associated protein
LYWTNYGFGVVHALPRQDDGTYQRGYRWNERNLLTESGDSLYTVHYRYGADGQRALKYVSNNKISTLYFNRMWQITDSRAEWLQSKHIYVGESRIATKYNSEGTANTDAEATRTYYYHSDHLGSAQTVTNHAGAVHERLEYTPYGELWIDWRSDTAPEDATPFRFTGQILDPETGLYYFGARYLDPKTARWLGVDPALGEYVPVAPVSDEAKKHNQNLPGLGGVFKTINLHVYHYAANNPIVYIDPDGERIDIQIHKVIGPWYHASIRITLDTQELIDAYKNHSMFEDAQTDSEGKLYITIGAGGISGKLVADINRERDVDETIKVDIKPLDMSGKNEIDEIQKFLDAYNAYENDLDYFWFPGKKNEKYNSNSFVRGILEKLGFKPPEFTKKMPGYDKAIPLPDIKKE